MSPSSSGLGHRPLTPETGVRLSLETPRPLSYIRPRYTSLAEEVLDEKFSVEYIKNGYGVLIDPSARILEQKAMAELRGHLATTEASQRDAKSHVEHFVRSLGLDPRLGHRAKASRSG